MSLDCQVAYASAYDSIQKKQDDVRHIVAYFTISLNLVKVGIFLAQKYCVPIMNKTNKRRPSSLSF